MEAADSDNGLEPEIRTRRKIPRLNVNGIGSSDLEDQSNWPRVPLLSLASYRLRLELMNCQIGRVDQDHHRASRHKSFVRCDLRLLDCWWHRDCCRRLTQRQSCQRCASPLAGRAGHGSFQRTHFTHSNPFHHHRKVPRRWQQPPRNSRRSACNPWASESSCNARKVKRPPLAASCCPIRLAKSRLEAPWLQSAAASCWMTAPEPPASCKRATWSCSAATPAKP